MKKWFVIMVLFIYSFMILFWNIPFYSIIKNVYAESVAEKDNLVLVIVDSNVYNSNKQDISWYASYIQNKNKNTKAIVFPVNVNTVKSTDILNVIRNLYFEWEKSNSSELIWLVLIWNVPLPVVNKDNFIYPSIYPYVDIVKPAFKYDWRYFSYTWKPSNVEIFHWVIKLKWLSDYHRYFNKLKIYAANPSKFVEKRFYYYNFVDLRKSLNTNALNYYVSKLLFAENLITWKVSPLLLQFFDEKIQQWMKKLLKSISWTNKTKYPIDLNSSIVWSILWFNSDDAKRFADLQDEYNKKTSAYIDHFWRVLNKAYNETKNPYWQMPIKRLWSSIKSFFKDFVQSFWNSYASTISENLKATWRYKWENTVSVLNSIDVIDTLSINYLKKINDALEKWLDDKINKHKYFMYYPIMVEYVEWTKNINKPCWTTYETFFFWKNVLEDINNLSDLTIYRWTYQNYTWLNVLKKTPSRWAKSVLSNVWIFSSQIEANRAYDTLNSAWKDEKDFSKKCIKKYWWCIDSWKFSDKESAKDWSIRIYWWYSPLNIDSSKITELKYKNNEKQLKKYWWKKNYYKLPLSYKNFKYAWHPIWLPDKNWTLFDLAWSIYTDKHYETDDVSYILKNYSAVRKTSKSVLTWKKVKICVPVRNFKWLKKISWFYYDYIKNYWEIKPSNVVLNWNILKIVANWVYHEDPEDKNNENVEKGSVMTYKFIDTRIKHTNPTSKTYSWINIWTRAKPIDEKNYISFLWVWGNTVKLYYPDIFSVNTYKKVWNKFVLKTPKEIADTIKQYLKNKVKEYNNKLKNELNKKVSFYNKYKWAWSSISNDYYKPHNYNLLPENYLIDLLWKDKIAKIAWILYYLNLWWKEKPIESNLSGELNSLYNSFDLYEKFDYLVKNYLDTEDKYKIDWVDISHSIINFPEKPQNWYEAWLILSKNMDDTPDISLNKENKEENDIDHVLSWINNTWVNWIEKINSIISSLSAGSAWEKIWNDILPIMKYGKKNNPIIKKAKNECWTTLWKPVILWKWPAALMCWLKNIMKRPFKVWLTDDCVASNHSFNAFKKMLESLNVWPEKDLKLPINNNFSRWNNWSWWNSNLTWKNESLQDYLNSHPSDKIRYEQWLKIKNFVDNYYIVSTDKWVYNYEDMSGYVQVKSSVVVNEINNPVKEIQFVSPIITWNCIYFKNWKNFANSCEWISFNLSDTWKFPFNFYNPNTQEWHYYAYKAWQRVLYAKFCNANNICYTKPVYFSKRYWFLKYVEIKPFSYSMVYWAENPVIIRWYDALPEQHIYQNQIKDTYYNYILELEPSVGKIKTDMWNESYKLDYNFSSDLLIIKTLTEKKNISKFKLIWKLDPSWNVLSWKVLKSFSTTINIVSNTTPFSYNVETFPSMKNIILPDDPSYFFTWNTFDKTKIWKIKIKPSVWKNILKTAVKIENTDKHFIIWTYQNWQFVQQNDFLITNENWIIVYAVPTYITWPFNINIKIPWVKTYKIHWVIKNFPIESLQVKLDKYQADPNEIVKWKIYGVDKFGNLVSDLKWLSISSSNNIKVSHNWNDLKIKWTRTGFIKFSYVNSDKKKISLSVRFWINTTFIPIDTRLSVMYLTMFWYDWWKYAQKIMANSTKNLAITTTLAYPWNLHRYDYLVNQDLSSNWELKLDYSWWKVFVDFWWLKVFTNQNPLKNVKYIKAPDLITKKWIYYIPQRLDDIIKSNFINNWILQINNKVVADFKNWKIYTWLMIISNKDKTKKYWLSVYDTFYNWKLVWEIIIKWTYFKVALFKINYPFFTKIIYWDATTNWQKSFWISVTDAKYSPISKNTDIDVENDKWLCFRSNFKNITNFAAWQNVWEATKPFESELLLNYWDPFVKIISRNDMIEQVKMSKTYWYNVHFNIAWWIDKVLTLDFNNDWKKDLLIVYRWSKIRLLKNYAWWKHFRDLWNLMILDQSVKDVFAWDYNGDWYQDLYILFDNWTIRVYKNRHWDFDANWTPVCLHLAKSNPYRLKYSQIFFKDMNNDKKTDIVVNDLVWNIKIFYWWSYLSKILTGCDAGFRSRLKEQLVKSYWLKIDSNQKFADDWYVYREWLKKSSSTLLRDQIQQAFKSWDLSSIPVVSGVTPQNYINQVQKKWQNKVAFQQIPAVLWPSYIKITWDTIEFKKITFLNKSDPINVYKIMKDLNWWNLEYWDKVKVTVYFENPKHVKFTYLESLKWPFWVISKDNIPKLELNWISMWNISYNKNYPIFLFRIDGANTSSSVSYYAIYQWSSQVKIKVWKFDDKNKFWSIKVFMKNGCIKWYEYFKGENWNIPMKFSKKFVDLKALLKKKLESLSTTKSVNNILPTVKKALEAAQKWDISLAQKIINKYTKIDDPKDNPWNLWTNDFWLDWKPDAHKFKTKFDDALNSMCNWFWIWKASCWWINVPCNFAFFAPWFINVCWCPGWFDRWTSVFWNPWTKWKSCHWHRCCKPIPMPLQTSISPSVDPPNQFKPNPCPWVYLSQFRVYLAPTLTASLWVALCWWPYPKWITSPIAPVWTIVWNCVVTATSLLPPKCPKKKAKKADDEEEWWMLDLDNWVCNQLPFKHWMYPSTSINIPTSRSFYWSSINPNYQNIAKIWWWLINFDMTAHKINSYKKSKVLLKWWKPFHLKIKKWTLKWIIDCVIKKWLNKQIQFLISNLTHMTLYVSYPDFDWFIDKFKDFWKLTDKDLKPFLDNSIESLSIGWWSNWWSEITEKLINYMPSKKGLKSLSNQLSNPFDKLKLFLEKNPLLKVSEKTLVLNIPWIWKDELERQITYLKNWKKRNEKTIKEWQQFYASPAWKCKKLYPNNIQKQKRCEQFYLNALNVQKFVNSIQKNIEILESYRNIPLQLYQYVHLYDFYLTQISCIANKYIDWIVWRLDRNSKMFEKWVDTIFLDIKIIKTWQILIDMSAKWKLSCWKCREDNWDLYDCLLIWLCPKLPVIPIPPFKIPDVYIDLSHINLWFNIILPKIKINPISLWLLTVPNLPPPWLNIDLPEVPLFPNPPVLPKLPSLPKVPTLDLPNLPPPLLLPKLIPALKWAIKVFKIITRYRCIIKHWIWFMAEWNVKTRIEQLTARTNRLFPFDFLNVDLPILPYKGYDIKSDAFLNYNASFDQVYKIVKWIVEPINRQTSKMSDDVLNLNIKLNNATSKFKINNLNININPGAFVLPKNTSNKLVKAYLYDQLKYLLNEKDKEYLNSLPSYIFKNAQEISNSVLKTPDVIPNYQWFYWLKNKINNLVYKEKIELNKIKKIIGSIWSWKVSKIDLISNNSNKFNDKKYVFNAQLFKVSDYFIKEINTYNPKVMYLNMFKTTLEKINEKISKYKSEKFSNYNVVYDKIDIPVKNSLKIINNKLWINFANNNISSNTVSYDSVMVDPNQFIRWLYMKWTDWTYYNVMADKKKARRIRSDETYLITDMNNDKNNDLIWYDHYNVYIKYSNDVPENNWTTYKQLYIYDNTISNFSSIIDKNWYVKINWIKFKIWDNKPPINDLLSNWWNFDQIMLSWKNSKDVNAYAILYSSRPDILDEIEKKFNNSDHFNWAWKDYQTYWVVLYDSKLWKINEILASKIRINWHKAKYWIYIPVKEWRNRDNIFAVLRKEFLKLWDNWKYFRVLKAHLNLEIKQLTILSSYSNQDVWLEQLIWDDEWPILKVNLIRNEKQVIWTWFNINAYINTRYVLKWQWKDNIALRWSFITDENYNLLTNENYIILNEKKPVRKVFHFIWVDWNDNEEDIKVTINFDVPSIEIKKVDFKNWFVVAKVGKDMDKTAVKFFVKSNWHYISLKTISWKEVFTWWVWKVIFTWAIFKPNKNVILYNSAKKIIGNFNLETWIVKVKKPYKIYAVSSWWLLYTEVLRPVNEVQYEPIFRIYVPYQKLVLNPEMLNTSEFELKEIKWENRLWIFADSYCIFDKNTKSCAIFISKKNWQIYIDPDYSFVATYAPNELWNVRYIFYNTPVTATSLLTNKNKIFSVMIKPENILKVKK